MGKAAFALLHPRQSLCFATIGSLGRHYRRTKDCPAYMGVHSRFPPASPALDCGCHGISFGVIAARSSDTMSSAVRIPRRIPVDSVGGMRRARRTAHRNGDDQLRGSPPANRLHIPIGTIPPTTFRPWEMSPIQTMLAAQVPMLEARRGQRPSSRHLQPAAAESDTGPRD